MNAPTSTKIQLSIISFGIIIGAVGILHGISEIMQGSAIVETNNIAALPNNWPNAEFYDKMQGQPAFSVLTGISFNVLGALAIIASLALIVHSALFTGKKNGLLIFGLLNVAIALFGAGVGTPVTLGIPLIIFGILSNRTKTKKERSESANTMNLRLFNIFYWLQIFSWVLFFPGLLIVSAYGEIPEPLFLFDFMLMPVSILGALIFGFRYDNTIQNSNPESHV